MAGGARAYLRAQLREQRRIHSIEPPAPRPLLARVGRWAVAVILREFAWQLSLLIAGALGALRSAGLLRRRAGRAIALVLGAGLVTELRHAVSAHRSAGRVEEALEGLPEGEGRRMPLTHLALPPLMFFARDVERERGIVYAEPDGERLRLDIYRNRERPSRPAPAVIQVHGGAWLSGSRHEQGIPLLNHLASLGWTGFNIDYRLSPKATWPDHIVDVKSAIAWVRAHAGELGIDPELIAITGGSAGGHLTALAGLTENDPALQPNFEDADTSVLAAVPFYGVYDLTDTDSAYYPHLREWTFEQVVIKRALADAEDLYREASPRWRVHQDAPPFMVLHGERDTLVPVADAREFVAELRRLSRSEVRYVELPGAEHAFDLWPSVRTARVADAIGRFLTAIVERRHEGGAVAAGLETEDG
jgi:acetyl esterase/lipase